MMNDLISRNDAIEAIDFKKVYITAYLGYVSEGNPLKQYNEGLNDAIKTINKLPSVEPEQKKGKWIDGMLYYDFDESEWEKIKCSVCKNFVTKQIFYHDNKYHYCPYCGAEMEMK